MRDETEKKSAPEAVDRSSAGFPAAGHMVGADYESYGKRE